MQTFETPGSVSLRIRLPGGRVVVTVAEAPRTSVELVPTGRLGHDALEDVVVRADETPGGHEITIEQKERFRWGPIQITWGRDFEVRVTCPPGTDLDLSGGSTDLTVEGELGSVSVKTASGDASLGVVRGTLQVKTASGDVSVAAMESEGSIQTVSGEVEVGTVLGTLSARSVSGGGRFRVVRAPLTLSTTSGDVTVDAIEDGELRIQSVSGDVRIGVGRGTRVWIDAVSVSGELASELGIADEAPSTEGPSDSGPDVVPLHVKTVSGDVAIISGAETLSAS